MAFRRFDTPNMKACYSGEWVFYLEESGKRDDGRRKMNIYAEMERRHGTGGLLAGKWEFPLTKVLVCPKESPRQQVRLQEWIFMQLAAKDTKDTKKMKDRAKKGQHLPYNTSHRPPIDLPCKIKDGRWGE